jgi:hypothetical protein
MSPLRYRTEAAAVACFLTFAGAFHGLRILTRWAAGLETPEC